MTNIAHLATRGVIKISGADAKILLQDILTCEVEGLTEGEAAYGALLTPQGKYLFDFILVDRGDHLLLDCAAGRVGDLIKRLTLYKLRADMVIEDASAALPVHVAWGGPLPEEAVADPRLEVLGGRIYGPADVNAEAEAWHALRIANAVPDGPPDIEIDKTFWLEAGAERLNGVAFGKGCYVGQEQTARMRYRGTVKKGVVALDGVAPTGSSLLAGEKEIGTIGSSAGGMCLAFVRFEKLAAAQEQNLPLSAANVSLKVHSSDTEGT